MLSEREREIKKIIENTMLNKEITYPQKQSTRTILKITVARFELSQINFEKLLDTYCIRVSCVTLPA